MTRKQEYMKEYHQKWYQTNRQKILARVKARGPEYQAWRGMKNRCYRKKTSAFERYGGRGITVCPQWLNSFEQFLLDMGPRPSPQHSLDRKNNDGNYEPANCRWATDAEQRRNQRRTKLITIDDQTLCSKDWAIRYGISHKTLHMRLKHGWDHVDAVTRPVRELKRR